MEFFTIYSTKDKQEVSILKNIYDQEQIEYRVLEPENPLDDPTTIQVAENEKEKARELLEQTGFMSMGPLHAHKPRRTAGKKWIFIFLAALILILVAILITWFMNAE